MPELERVLTGNEDFASKQEIIYVLMKMGTPDAAKALVKALEDTDSHIRFKSAVALREMPYEGLVDKAVLWKIIAAGLLDEDSNIRSSAAYTLARMDRIKAVPLLIETLDREFKKPREKRGTYQRPESLKFHGEDNTISGCIGSLSLIAIASGNASVIEASVGKGNKDLDYCLAYVLTNINHKPYKTELLTEGATKCSSATVRTNIIYHLWKIDDPRVEKILRQALNDPYTAVVPETRETIYPIRWAAEKSLKRLESRAKGEDPWAVVDLPLPASSHTPKPAESKPQTNKQ